MNNDQMKITITVRVNGQTQNVSMARALHLTTAPTGRRNQILGIADDTVLSVMALLQLESSPDE